MRSRPHFIIHPKTRKLCQPISKWVPASNQEKIMQPKERDGLLLSSAVPKIISIFHVCMVWIEKSVTRVTDRHHEACRVMPNSDPE